MRSTRHRRFVPDRFGRLLDALRPTPEEVRRAHAVGAEAAGRMRALIRPALTEPVTDSLIVGALGLECAIWPLDTLDMLYLMPAHMREDGMPAPAALLDRLAHLLGPDAGRTMDGVILQDRGTACRIQPAFAIRDGRFAVPHEAEGRWRSEDPLAAAVGLRAAGAPARDVLRPAEAWRRHARVPASDAAVRGAAFDFARRCFGRSPLWDRLSAELFGHLADHADSAWVFHAKRAETATLNARRALSACRYAEATEA